MRKVFVKIGSLLASIMMVLVTVGFAHAIPILQVGVPGSIPGTYVPYSAKGTNPTETNTAFTSGNIIVVGGLVAPVQVSGQKGKTIVTTEYLGGKADDGLNWSNYGLPSIADTHGAILLASVPNGMGLQAFGSLRINGASAFSWDASKSYFPTNHSPVTDKISDFLFFDIGSFSSNPNAVPDFADPTGTPADGEIKRLSMSGMDDLPWVHWDVMAIKTTVVEGKAASDLITNSLKSNPASHDVTWDMPEESDVTGDSVPVPAPAPLLLLGSGLVCLIRKKNRG